MKKNLYIMIIACISCANPVSPTGGSKDITAPKIIKVTHDTLNQTKRVTIYFDEHIQFTNEVNLNPKKSKENKPNIIKGKKNIIIPLKKHHNSISLSNSIKDLNEGNKGIFAPLIIGNDTFHGKHPYKLNKYFKADQKSLYAEVKIDSLIYTSYNIEDTLYIEGFPNNTKNLTYYIDKNKNREYDSTEWAYTGIYDTIGPTNLYPPKSIIINVDTTFQDVVCILPFYAINKRIQEISKIQSNDTFIFNKDSFNKIQKHIDYKISYKGIKLKPYVIKQQINGLLDTQIRYINSIGVYINPNSNKDTLTTIIKNGEVVFQLTDSIKKLNHPIQIILTEKGNSYINSFTIQTQSFAHSLSYGEYNITAFIDLNNNGLLDQNKHSSDSILHFMEPFAIKGNTTTVFNLGSSVNNSTPAGGKTKSQIPVNLRIKKSVDQRQTIEE